LDQWYGPFSGRSFQANGYPYRIDPNVRLDSGLTLESALLFNLPTYQPNGFYVREVRASQTSCVNPISSAGNNLDYLDDFPVQMGKYIQGAVEASINPNNGIRDSNRGYNDVMAILIRRGRELGVPSFTDIREQISLTPSGCQWNSWDGVGACDPALLFKPSALAGLKLLYNTPGDVELVVGAALSVDTVSAGVSQALHDSGIDQTQAWLLFGEVDRILNLDAFGRFTINSVDSFYARFRNDDPGVGVNGGRWAERFILDVISKTSVLLIQHNTNVQCLPTAAFAVGGFNTFLVPGYGNTFNIPFATDDFAQYSNCDISEDTMVTFYDPVNMLSYYDYYCEGVVTPCWRPNFPFCV
jgi:hypothetical protein